MRLWLISQDVNTEYDSYDSAVVAAMTREDAAKTYPAEGTIWDGMWFGELSNGRRYEYHDSAWTTPDKVSAELIGIAQDGTQPGVICASFNAG